VAIISVSDEGIGIPPEDRDRILRPFFSTKARGTGLGLSITRRIVEEHGGTIDFTSEPGNGTTFTIRLPAT
jgi:two-component system NtrC family sensor kinase